MQKIEYVRKCLQVRNALDGRHIPKHLLNNTPYPPLLKITFSQHTDLNVRVQSHRSRYQLHSKVCKLKEMTASLTPEVRDLGIGEGKYLAVALKDIVFLVRARQLAF